MFFSHIVKAFNKWAPLPLPKKIAGYGPEASVYTSVSKQPQAVRQLHDT